MSAEGTGCIRPDEVEWHAGVQCIPILDLYILIKSLIRESFCVDSPIRT